MFFSFFKTLKKAFASSRNSTVKANEITSCRCTESDRLEKIHSVYLWREHFKHYFCLTADIVEKPFFLALGYSAHET